MNATTVGVDLAKNVFVVFSPMLWAACWRPVHLACALTVSERTALVNQVRGLLGEFGIVARAGIAHARKLLAQIGSEGQSLNPCSHRDAKHTWPR